MEVFILEGYKTATGRRDDRKGRISRRKEKMLLSGRTRERKLPFLHTRQLVSQQVTAATQQHFCLLEGHICQQLPRGKGSLVTLQAVFTGSFLPFSLNI